jgi:hypothetical protein
MDVSISIEVRWFGPWYKPREWKSVWYIIHQLIQCRFFCHVYVRMIVYEITTFRLLSCVLVFFFFWESACIIQRLENVDQWTTCGRCTTVDAHVLAKGSLNCVLDVARVNKACLCENGCHLELLGSFSLKCWDFSQKETQNWTMHIRREVLLMRTWNQGPITEAIGR